MLRTTCSECARLALRNRHSSGRNIARFASTSAQIDATSESLSQDLPLIQQSHPSLADLEALRPKLRPPSASILTDSPDFAVYTKRFDRAVNSLGRAFKRDQILKIARDDLRMQSLTSRTTKSAIIHQIIRDHWRLPDPQQIIAEEKAAVEEHTREPDPTKQEKIPITTSEVQLLLGRLGEPNVLQDLSVKHDVQASCVGSPPNNLQLEGLPQDVARAKDAWQKMKKDIRTQEIATGLAGTIRPELCKAISAASQTLVVPSRTGKVRVTSLSTSTKAQAKVASMLRQIAWVENIELVTPTVHMQTGGAFPAYTQLPFLPHEKYGWMLNDLPLDSLSRQTYEGEFGAQPELNGDVLKMLQAQMGDTSSEPVLEVRFGHHLSLSNGDGSQRVFLPATLPEVATRLIHPSPRANVSMIRRHAAGLEHKSTEYRRLVYVSKPSTLPLRYVECSRKRQSKQLQYENAPTWQVNVVREALCTIEMPSAPVDARMAFVEKSTVSDEDLAQLSSITDQAAPSMLTISGEEYTLFDDAFRRDTIISSGLPPWTDLSDAEVTLARTRQHNTRYSSVIIRTTDEACSAVISALQELARGRSTSNAEDIFSQSGFSWALTR